MIEKCQSEKFLYEVFYAILIFLVSNFFGCMTELTLSWPGKILLHPKIRCFNFKPQYLLNYTSPTNDLYSVRKRSIGAFKSIFKLLGLGPASFAALAPNFAPKLCTRRVSACFSTCFKTCRGRFDPMLIPVG